jgi:hypothetical protein
VLLLEVLPGVLLRLEPRIDYSVGVLGLTDAKGVVVRIVSNILFLRCGVQYALQER